MSEFRLLRAEKIIQEEISTMIIQGHIKDPRINRMIVISRVAISKDMGYAKIYISGYCKEEQTLKSVDALNHASGFIQKNLGKKLKTRLTPRVTFYYDKSLKDGFEINRMIEESLH